MVQMLNNSSSTHMDIHTSTPFTLQSGNTVCKHGLHKKVKKSRQTSIYFVLHSDSLSTPARLEYYKSKSHWDKGKTPKRTVYLKTCFSINAFSDSRVKSGLTIFTTDDSFHIGFECEETRDSWLMAMRALCNTHFTYHSICEHIWKAKVQTRNMHHCRLEGDFQLCLNDKQVTLISRNNTKQFVFPLEVVCQYGHNGAFFKMEVSRMADTGPGEIWMEVEDSLIARNVHATFLKNLASRSPKHFGSRPTSRSWSYKDNSSFRPRTSSDTWQLRENQGACALPLSVSQSNSATSLGCPRDRSDSIDSQGTNTSLSTDDSIDCSRLSRSTTPDSRQANSYVLMSSSGSDGANRSENSGYAHMSGNRFDRNSNFVYIDMTGNQSHAETDSHSSGYIDMTCGQCSPSAKLSKAGLESVKSYLADDTTDDEQVDRRHYSVGSRPHRTQRQNTEGYVEMCRRPALSERDKSSSAPHLQPSAPTDSYCHKCLEHSQPMSMDLGSHRPRGSSWSQFIRPRVGSHGHRNKSRKTKKHELNESSYSEMCRNSRSDAYVDMTPGPARLSSARNCEDKENCYPNSRSTNGGHVLCEPFPELSASSEDDLSLHSMEGSVRSSDSMSTSSHSSHHAPYAGPSPAFDVDSYVAMQAVPSRCVPKPPSSRMLIKPAKATSFIVDDRPNEQSDYMEMNPRCNTPLPEPPK